MQGSEAESVRTQRLLGNMLNRCQINVCMYKQILTEAVAYSTMYKRMNP